MQWIKEFELFLPQTSQFLISGNIYDSYFYEKTPMDLTNFLARYLVEKQKYTQVISYIPLSGFFHVYGNQEAFKSLIKENILNLERKSSLEKDYEIISTLLENQTYPIAIIINFASRIDNIAKDDFEIFLFKMFKDTIKNKIKKVITPKGMRSNLIIYLLDKEGDIPTWFYIEKPKIKSILIQKPNIIARKQAIENLLETFEEKNEKLINEIVDKTHGMFIRDIISIFQISKQNNISFSQAIRTYKTGIKENPWESIDKDKIKNIENFLEEKVKGQEKAIKKVAETIKRAYFNLSGSQFSENSQKPKGVLFFAGPTGVGKTELAKTIAEIIFGTKDAMIRFDMSEFRHDHADQRLLGAPPGYVGYNEGGELINKIRENPFSVILFDEIEKAHPRIMDIMLQLLDEGTLTSGRGEKAYFSESIIIFTSNLGAADTNIENSYEKNEKIIKQKIENYFKKVISRPEILNRIGKNIIVFDYIRENSAKEIAKHMIQRVIKKIKNEKNITIQIEQLDKLLSLLTLDTSMGGRGIGNEIEEKFINPLSVLMFEKDVKNGKSIKILLKDKKLDIEVLN